MSSERVGSRSGRWVLVTTILGSSLAFIDGTVVNVALPALQTGLGATASQLQWVVEAYALFLAALLLVGGGLGDRFGRRRVFVAGVVIFALASGWCGLAPSITQLIWSRAVQGIGAALLVPGSLALISSSFPDAERGRAIGTWSGFTAMTAAVGPLLGGWLVEHVSWRAVFFINLPIAVAVVLIAQTRVAETEREASPTGLDWAGALLATVGLGAVTYSLLEWTGGGTGVRLLSGLGAAALVLFVVVEARSRTPMVPLELFRSRNFAGANLLTLFLYGALTGLFYYLPLELIQVQRYTPTAAGAALLPFILLISVLSRWSGGLVQRYGARTPLILGPVLSGVGFGLLLRAGTGRSYWTTLLPALVVLGLGMAISVAPLTTVVMESVAERYAGAASGVNNALSRVGGLLALAAFGIMVAHTFDGALQAGLRRAGVTPEVARSVLSQRARLAAIQTENTQAQRVVGAAFISGYDRVLVTGALLCAAASLSAVLLIHPQRSR